MNDFQEKLLEVYRSFQELCKIHDIHYYAYGGTLIGAIRHHGFIPWDDDIDVLMKRPDYEKFCSLRGKVDGHYDIMTEDEDNYWLLSLAKYYDTNTTLWEVEHFPCLTGAYIDVFVLEECDYENALKLRKEYDKWSYCLTYSMMRHTWHQFWDLVRHGSVKSLIHLVIETCYYRPRQSFFRRKFDDVVKEIRNQKGDRLVSYDGMYKEREIYKKEWFESSSSMPFETLTIPVPNGYHEILTQVFGNYMQLPPEEKRVSHHNHYFLDLDRRWTIDEIKEYKKRHK